MSVVAGITFFPYFLTVTDILTIACVHISTSITVGNFVSAAACFPAVTCIHASDGVPAVDRVHAVASAPTLLSSLPILAYPPTFTGHCELQKCYTIGLLDFGYFIVHFFMLLE
jgi:hypothetical protein